MRVLWVEENWRNAGAEPPDDAQTGAFPANATVDTVQNGIAALEHLAEGNFAAVLVRFPLTDWTPEDFLVEVQRVDANMPVVLHIPATPVGDAVRLIKLGAFHVFGEDWEPAAAWQVLESAIENARLSDLRRLCLAVPDEPWRRLLVGDEPAMHAVLRTVQLVSARRCTVLISGETGTGKEMAARAIHLAGRGPQTPFVAVNCSALPEALFEAELFGHVKGAFTGAMQSRIGRFEQANHGTIFLDEIADMPLEVQSKLLRALQDREFQRLGSGETIRVDVRVIAATNVDLHERVERRQFREDLFYRLHVVPLMMPSLRERPRDIPLLVRHFIDKVCRMEGLPAKRVSSETLEALTRHSWPGNVRQLENAVERAVTFSADRDTLLVGDFPLPSDLPRKRATIGRTGATSLLSVPDAGIDFDATVAEIERDLIEQALRRSGGNKKQAADLLGLKRTTLTAKLKTLGATA